MRTHNIYELIGNTPLVRSRSLGTKPGVQLYFKMEGHNPGGRVKDRPALNMIKSALERGQIGPQSKLIEATSGNTGIALSMIAQIFGLDIELVMPENSTRERVQTMRAFGAAVTLTPQEDGIEGSRDYAEAKVRDEGFVMLNQFGNPRMCRGAHELLRYLHKTALGAEIQEMVVRTHLLHRVRQPLVLGHMLVRILFRRDEHAAPEHPLRVGLPARRTGHLFDEEG